MKSPQRILPGPGQASVWDYPRPPCVEAFDGAIRIIFNGVEIAHTLRAKRVLETSHPPVYYLPPDDIRMACLQAHHETSVCEWKGGARYFTLAVGDQIAERVAWSYPVPTPAFLLIKDHIAFFASPMDGCYVRDELVVPQPGDFYGGWITKDIVGPFKGTPGTMHW
jgi:uncharacterized protein (DUF427 family)